MDTDNDAQPARERHLATTEERKVFALERIADDLQNIARDLSRIGDAWGAGNDRAADGWENDDSQAEPEAPEASRFKPRLVGHFPVGGYSYTNLAHAIAEAKRARHQGDV